MIPSPPEGSAARPPHPRGGAAASFADEGAQGLLGGLAIFSRGISGVFVGTAGLSMVCWLGAQFHGQRCGIISWLDSCARLPWSGSGLRNSIDVVSFRSLAW